MQVGLFEVDVEAEFEERSQTHAGIELADQLEQRLAIVGVELGDLGEVGLERRGPGRVDLGLVHARAVIGTWPAFILLEDAAQDLVVPLTQLAEAPPPARLVARQWVAGDPATARKLVEVDTGIGGQIHLRDDTLPDLAAALQRHHRLGDVGVLHITATIGALSGGLARGQQREAEQCGSNEWMPRHAGQHARFDPITRCLGFLERVCEP